MNFGEISLLEPRDKKSAGGAGRIAGEMIEGRMTTGNWGITRRTGKSEGGWTDG